MGFPAKKRVLTEGGFCHRCGTEDCVVPCCSLKLFKTVRSLWSVQSPEGELMTRMKRGKSPEDLTDFYAELVDPICDALETAVLDSGAHRIVIMPASTSSIIRQVKHPNLEVFHEVCQRLKHKNSAFHYLKPSVELYLRKAKSRSLSLSSGLGLPFKPKHPVSEQWHEAQSWRDLHLFSYQNLSDLESDSREGSAIVFFDDVLTTGHTASTTAATLDADMKSEWHLVSALRMLKEDQGQHLY